MEPSHRFVSSADLYNDLAESLTTYVKLYDQRKDALQQASERLTETATWINKNQDHNDTLALGLLSMLAGTLGGIAGGVCGGLWGALGAVGATTYTIFARRVNAVDASVGFFGSAIGGVVGGAFSGAIGCTIEVAAASSGHPIPGVVSNVLCITIGCVTGGAIGSIFGQSVSAVGGAFGGGVGAFSARIVGVYIAAGTTDYSSKSKYSREWEKQVETVKTTGQSFSGSIKPLVEELETIRKLCDKMASSKATKNVAGQTAKTLAAVMAMAKTFSDCQMAADQAESASCWEEEARQCKKSLEELERMRAEAEKLLVSLKEELRLEMKQK